LESAWHGCVETKQLERLIRDGAPEIRWELIEPPRGRLQRRAAQEPRQSPALNTKFWTIIADRDDSIFPKNAPSAMFLFLKHGVGGFQQGRIFYY
jgi:hypothetical protein